MLVVRSRGLQSEGPLLTTNNQQLTICYSGGAQGEEGYLGWAVEAEGQTYSADAAVDIELHLVEAIEALGILLTERRKDERTQKGEPDLAAVRVAGEHEVDEPAPRVGDDIVGVVGLVRHEDDGRVRFGGDGEIEVRMALAGVVDAAEPEALAAALEGDELVNQDGRAGGMEGFDDGGSVVGDVVIAEAGVAKRGGQVGEDLGAAADCVAAGDEG